MFIPKPTQIDWRLSAKWNDWKRMRWRFCALTHCRIDTIFTRVANKSLAQILKYVRIVLQKTTADAISMFVSICVLPIYTRTSVHSLLFASNRGDGRSFGRSTSAAQAIVWLKLDFVFCSATTTRKRHWIERLSTFYQFVGVNQSPGLHENMIFSSSSIFFATTSYYGRNWMKMRQTNRCHLNFSLNTLLFLFYRIVWI